MPVTRRAALVGVSAVATIAAVAPMLRPGMRAFLYQILETNFGGAIAGHPRAEAFLAEFDAEAQGRRAAWKRVAVDAYFNYEIDRLGQSRRALENLERETIRAFLQSTNILQVLEGKADLEFTGLFDPYEAPCSNHLAAPP